MVSAWHQIDEHASYKSKKGTKMKSSEGRHIKGQVGSIKRNLKPEEIETVRECLSCGCTIVEALNEIDAGRKVFRRWMKENEDFKKVIDEHRARQKKKGHNAIEEGLL